MSTPIIDRAIVDRAIVGVDVGYPEITEYRGLNVYTGSKITVGSPIGLTTPKFNIESGVMYTLQWKCCMKTPHTVFDYVLVGGQKLPSVSVLDCKVVGIVDDRPEYLCSIEFIAEQTKHEVVAIIGRLQDVVDVASTACFSIRDVQISKGGMVDYTPNPYNINTIANYLQTQINQTSSKLSLTATKQQLDTLSGSIKNAEASINIQAGLIEQKVSEGNLSSLIKQYPTEIQYAFNGVNPRYVYTDDGFYMKSSSGYNKASLKRGSFYCYNYNNGQFLGGLTPFIFGDDAGTGIMNASKSRFFTIGRDSSLSSDNVESATNFNTFLTLNFTDRVGEGSFYKKGLQVSTPTYFHDGVSFTGHDLTSINTVNAQTLNITGTTDTDKLWSNIQYCSYIKDRFGYQSGNSWVNGHNVFYFGESFCTNYRNWDWNNKNLVNCNWVYSLPTEQVATTNDTEVISVDDFDVVATDKLVLVNKVNPYSEVVDVTTDNTLSMEQLIFALVKEVKDLKRELSEIRGS